MQAAPGEAWLGEGAYLHNTAHPLLRIPSHGGLQGSYAIHVITVGRRCAYTSVRIEAQGC